MPSINGLPYPALSDPNNPPADFLALATAVDGKLNALDGSKVTTGTVSAARLPNLDGLTGTLSVANGGTGATTASDAQTNLRVGLIPMIPGSIVNTGGTVSSGLVGFVYFQNVQQLELRNVFQAGFDNYKIVFSTWVSTTCNVRMRLMNGASAATDPNYQFGAVALPSTGSIGSVQGINQTSFILYDATSVNNQFNQIGIDISTPRHPDFFTNIAYKGSYINSNAFGLAGGGVFRASQAHDGFQIYPSAVGGTMTGLMQVFGYKE